MNNGVNNENVVNNEEQSTLAPMAGVKIAPAEEGPVNASSGNSTAVVNAKKEEPKLTVSGETVQLNVVQPNTGVQPQPAPSQPQIVTAEQVNNTTQTTEQPQVAYSRLADPIKEERKLKEEQELQEQAQIINENPKPKKTVNILPILLVIIIALIGYIVYMNNSNQKDMINLRYNCTPVNASKEEKELDLNSTLVKDLYGKVETNVREDLANPNFDDNMRLYLAYRQIKDKDKYDSNCNLFLPGAMEPYTCEESTRFNPTAFKAETLQDEVKKLFGEETNIPLKNIQLGSTCIVGYQYIANRGDNGEFVEGYCDKQIATSFKANKTLIKATTTRNTIVLTEEVKYIESEKQQLPDTLVSGIYKYTFRLDMNYNYVLVSKTFESKY